MEFNFKPKVAGAGSFSPPPGYELVNGQWVNTTDIFEESITTTCPIKNDTDQDVPGCSGAEAKVNTKATESTGCAKAESTSEEPAE
jgi:hypothetical protein